MSAGKTVTGRRPDTRGEVIANTVSHGVGLGFAIAALPLLVVTAVQRGDAAQVVGVSIFGASMILLYLTSTLYHAISVPSSQKLLRTLDHIAIYVLIAGTYTPFTLGVLSGAWGWTLFGLIWGLALLGIVKKIVWGFRYPRLSVALYLCMGWVVVVATKPLLTSVEPAGLAWLLAGGLAYSLGVVFYASKHVRYSHFVWHLFVLTGTFCHFIAVLRYSG